MLQSVLTVAGGTTCGKTSPLWPRRRYRWWCSCQEERENKTMSRASAASPAPGGMLHISRATRSLLKHSCMLWADLTLSRKWPVEAAHSEVMSLGVILGTNGEPTQIMDSREQLHVDGQRQAFLGSPGRARRHSDTDSSAHVQVFTAGCMSGGRGLACEELSCSEAVRCVSPLRRGGGGRKKKN